MSSPTPTRRPRRRRFVRRALFVVAFVFAAILIVVWQFSWWAPPTYLPRAGSAPNELKFRSADHDSRVRALGDRRYILNIDRSPGPGSLLFFGALHSKDPAHPQISELHEAWERFHPTIALVEGRMSFFVGTSTQGIRIFGEGAAVYTLAQREGIPIYTLEPPLEVEIAALEECGDRAQVAMFRVLSGYMSARRGGAVSEWKIKRLLRRRAAPLTDAFRTIADFDRYFASQFPGEPDWRDLPENAMWPGQTDTLLHRMATRSNHVRDEHFVRTMLDLTQRGERVFVIAGRSHTIILEPVIWDLMQPATRGGISTPRPWE